MEQRYHEPQPKEFESQVTRNLFLTLPALGGVVLLLGLANNTGLFKSPEASSTPVDTERPSVPTVVAAPPAEPVSIKIDTANVPSNPAEDGCITVEAQRSIPSYAQLPNCND